MRYAIVPLILPLIIAASCEDPKAPESQQTPDEPEEQAPVVDCTAEVTEVDVDVSVGEDVGFDWSPRCRVAMLGVEAEDGDRWWIGSEEENLVEPPVTYGVTPEGVEPEEALPLIDGETYSVVLWIVTDEGEYLAAVHEFER